MINIYDSPSEIRTTDSVYWIIYNKSTLKLMVDPINCSGITSSPHTMVVFDTPEECMDYIMEHELISIDVDTVE